MTHRSSSAVEVWERTVARVFADRHSHPHTFTFATGETYGPVEHRATVRVAVSCLRRARGRA